MSGRPDETTAGEAPGTASSGTASGPGVAGHAPPNGVGGGPGGAAAGTGDVAGRGQAGDESENAADAELVEHDIDAALATAERERDEYLDMVRRVQADFENYKKRMVRQQTELLERAAEGLVTRLLPVLDAFDLARAHLEAEGSPEGKALLQAAGLLWDTLAKEGLERVD
ncbi:MAG TPA: nucleotide exchange factor GrpE, partial [Acidimicrobiales bacterium]|nr:nucleotide exchange factor GrpE [Acidimicrobiales bacterium]